MPPKKKAAAKKKSSNKGTAILKQLHKYAKEYQKEHPNAKWTTAMKHAGVKYRANKK